MHMSARSALSLSVFTAVFQIDLGYTVYQNVSTLDFIGAKMMELAMTTGAITRAKLQPNRQHQQTNT